MTLSKARPARVELRHSIAITLMVVVAWWLPLQQHGVGIRDIVDAFYLPSVDLGLPFLVSFGIALGLGLSVGAYAKPGRRRFGALAGGGWASAMYILTSIYVTWWPARNPITDVELILLVFLSTIGIVPAAIFEEARGKRT